MQPQYNVQQVAVPQPPRKNKSILLIIFGVTQIIVSIILFFICIWIITVNKHLTSNFITIFSCIYNASAGILSIIGGQNVREKRTFLITSVGLAFLGIVFINACTLKFISNSSATASSACDCEYSSKDYDDVGECFFTECDDIERVHLSIFIGVSIQLFLDVLIALVGFIYVCACGGCNKSLNYNNPGQVIQLSSQPPNAY